jgi:NAD(P)-dependent dehydrogenase (short-subunit alcohol dehydrogenase family)
MSDLFNLKGKTALVTGCNKGIGRAMALGLAEAGADIIGVSASMPLQDSDVEKEVLALGRRFTAYQADLTDRATLYALLSFQGGINVPGYAASKGAIASLVKALANEWASQGVNVNGIAPGYISTDNTEALRNDPVRSKSIMDRIPAGRWGEPDDFRGPAVFLASAAADYVHGTILTVDGGWMGR